MTAGNTLDAPIIGKASRALKSAEWLAENAYIAPGFHRLLMAGGLTAGLWGGRKLMDVVTARSAVDGQEVTPAHSPEIIRPLHGIMRYNPYSDAAADRWKFVVDRMTPVAFGAVSAYYGGKLFFHGRMPNGEAFSATTAAARKAWSEGAHSTDMLDTLLGIAHSDATRKWAAGTFIEGSAAGMHLPGALWPFNNGMVAVSFQQGARRSIFVPFMNRLNRWFGNYGGSSRYLQAAQRDTAKWMESNIAKYANPSEWLSEETLIRHVKDGLQKFPHRTAADEQRLASAYRKLIDDAYHFKAQHAGLSESELSQKIHDFVSGAHNSEHGLTGKAYDHFLHTNGFDLTKTKLAGDPWAFFSRLFGSRRHEQQLLEEYAGYLNKEFNYNLKPAEWAAEQVRVSPWKVGAAYGGAAAAIGGGLWGAGVAAHRIHKESSHTHKPHIHTPSAAPQPEAAEQPKHAGNLVEWVNGKPLDVAHWLSRVVITPPSMHRFMNAAYLSAVLFGGMKFANLLTARNLPKIMSGAVAESAIPLTHVWAPFKPLHGLLAYTPGSAAMQDRWRQAAHYIIPVGLGMFGTYTGSHMYFRDREKQLSKPQTLEDFADRISMEQSKVYAGATALTSIFNTGSGIHLLPIFNYSSNLHNRYLMGSGQQVAMPGIGKWWSGNAGTTPWGVKRSLRYMSNYLTHNPSARPRELPQLVHSVIGKLYPNLSESELLDKKQIMIDRIYDVRDSYLVEGAVPPSKLASLGKVMDTLLSGPGFEALLRASELDPLKANLANNGASGTIANTLGKANTVASLSTEYRQKAAERLAKQKPTAATDFLRELVDKGHPASDSAFAERIKAKPTQGQLLAT